MSDTASGNAADMAADMAAEAGTAPAGHHRFTVTEDLAGSRVDAGLASFVEPSAELSPEVALIPSHGHTPGHVSVLV